MKRNLILLTGGCLAICLLSCCNKVNDVLTAPPEETPATSTTLTPEEDVLPGELEVRFTEEMASYFISVIGDRSNSETLTKAFTDTKADGGSELLASLGIISIERIFPDAGKWEKRHHDWGLDRYFKVTFDPTLPSTKAVQKFAELPYVESAHSPYAKKTMAGIPFNDPYRRYQWNLYNDGSLGTSFKKGVDINVVPVWEKYTTGSKDVIVAVVDSGININHEDMEGVVIPGTDEGGSRSFVNGHEGPDLTNDAHGTHVASTIAAVSNNGKGIAGIAGGNDGTGGVRILGCQMLMEDPNDPDKVIQGNAANAIVWGADQGAVISQNSWGYTGNAHELTPADKAAIDYFIANAGMDENGKQVGPMAGGVIIFAAGNENVASAYPAGYDPVIAVGAVGPDGRKASYSNYGKWVDICAPGGDMEKAGSNGSILACAYDSYYFMDGTSMACPHVSAVAALLVSYYGGEGFTPQELTDRLLYGANANTAAKDDNIGPRLDALSSFEIGKISDPVITTTDMQIGEALTFKSHEKESFTFHVETPDNLSTTFTFTPGSKAASGVAKGNDFTVTFNALDEEPGSYNATLKASFGPGHESTVSISYTIEQNHAPVAKGSISPMIVEESTPITLDMSSYITDADGEIPTYTFEILSSRIVTASASGNTVTLKPQAFGDTEVKITATDARGASCTLPSFRFLYFDMSKGASIYPNPVSDYLYLSAGALKDISYTLISAQGQTLLENSVSASAFSPAQIDMRNFAAARYTLKIKYGETATEKIIVKQ